jgi:hypothetical protein
MKACLLLFCCTISFNAFCQLPDRQIHDLKTGRVKEDTSYVYWLPYKKENSYLFIQGANSKMSHQNELSFDFKMKQGSSICATREGIVIATKADSDHGGMKEEYLADGNHIIIRHEDGSVAQYWHLQKNGVLVSIGDSVQKGQAIGLSGNTGFTAFPHLHFQVIAASGREILPRFETKKGALYLRPGRWYKAVN